MTPDEIAGLLEQYRAGIEAELALLRQMADVAKDQRQATQSSDFVALGQIAHQSVVKALGGKLPKAKFGHLAEHRMPGGEVLIDSYHC